MLLVSRRSRAAVFVPVLFTAMTVAFLVASIAGLASHLSVGRGFAVALSVALTIMVVSDLRVVFALDGNVRVRSLFQRGDFDARVCSFTVSVVYSSRGGPSYDVYAGDGDAMGRTKVSFHFTKAGAGRAVRLLAMGVLGQDALSAHAGATAVVETLRRNERANLALSRAYMARAAPWTRALPWVFAIAMALAVLVSAFVMRR